MKKNWLEWFVFALGLLLVLGVAGFLVRESLSDSNSAPSLSLKTEKPKRTSAGYEVQVTVENTGKGTAEDVIIEGSSGEDKAQFQLAFVPRESKREGVLVFPSPPANDLEVRVLGYELP